MERPNLYCGIFGFGIEEFGLRIEKPAQESCVESAIINQKSEMIRFGIVEFGLRIEKPISESRAESAISSGLN